MYDDNDDTATIMRLQSRLVTMLEDISDAAKCVVPLNKGDKKIIAEGLEELNKYTEKLKSADNIREISMYLNVKKYMQNCENIDKKLFGNEANESFLNFLDSIQATIKNE